MKKFTFLKVDMFSVHTGTNISYWRESDLEIIKTIPEPTPDNDFIPDHITVTQVAVVVVNDNESIESIVLSMLNLQIVKHKKQVAKWTKATGWVDN